ncbi:MAG: tetratricopeptide repeat protein [Leptospiraceae bacterium]|nr:tetratricopeptide repeat protein [Leptospiraceae bacterium]
MIKILVLILSYSFINNIFCDDDIDELKPETKLEISRLVHSAQGLLRAKRYKEVEEIAKQIQAKSSNSPEPFYLRGAKSFYSQDLNQAKSELESAIKIKPEHDPSLFLLGMVYVKKNNWQRAGTYFEKACNNADFNPFYRYYLAVSLYINENFERAQEEAAKTLKLKENFFKAKLIQIRSLAKLDKNAEALFLAREMVNKNQELNSVISLYGELLAKEGNYLEVIKLLSKKASLTESEKRSLARSYLHEGESTKALNLFRQFVSPEKDSEEDSFGYMECLILEGKEQEAERYLSSIIKIFPDLKKPYHRELKRIIEKRNLSKDLHTPYPW